MSEAICRAEQLTVNSIYQTHDSVRGVERGRGKEEREGKTVGGEAGASKRPLYSTQPPPFPRRLSPRTPPVTVYDKYT